MEATELSKIVEKHKKWLADRTKGLRAVLTGADLTGADLTGAVLRDADLRDAVLRGADLRDADLTGAVLTGADLTGADLTGAVLTGAVLRDADLPSSVPVVPDIDQKIARLCAVPGALDMTSWHTCETTHCRAGWAIQLAGEAGRAMEIRYGPAAAGALIYAASRPGKPIPNFFESTEDAVKSILADAAAAVAA